MDFEKMDQAFLLAYLKELRELVHVFPHESIDASILAVIAKLDKLI